MVSQLGYLISKIWLQDVRGVIMASDWSTVVICTINDYKLLLPSGHITSLAKMRGEVANLYI